MFLRMNKTEARQLAKITRDNLDPKMRYIKSRTIVQKIERDQRFINAKVIGLYYPFSSEVDISSLTHKSGIIALPKIIEGKMEFIEINSKTKYKRSSFGVLEPVKGKIVSKEIDLLLISTLAKNRLNYRLGYGKGYYDKFIKEYKPKTTIGVLFDNYELDFIEDLWDIALDDYITN